MVEAELAIPDSLAKFRGSLDRRPVMITKLIKY
jgi:hypothetical protein